jgi:hypothetical protein
VAEDCPDEVPLPVAVLEVPVVELEQAAVISAPAITTGKISRRTALTGIAFR